MYERFYIRLIITDREKIFFICVSRTEDSIKFVGENALIPDQSKKILNMT